MYQPPWLVDRTLPESSMLCAGTLELAVTVLESSVGLIVTTTVLKSFVGSIVMTTILESFVGSKAMTTILVSFVVLVVSDYCSCILCGSNTI